MTHTSYQQGSQGDFPSSGDDLLIPIDVDPEQYFSLKIRSKGSFPLVSIETTSGQTVLEPSSFNRNTAQTPLLDPQLLASDSLVARVSTQGSRAGKFRLKLSRLGDLDDIRDDVIRFTNKQRRKHNLDPLSGDALLHQAAQGHVDDMDATGRYLGHDSSDGRSVVNALMRPVTNGVQSVKMSPVANVLRALLPKAG